MKTTENNEKNNDRFKRKASINSPVGIHERDGDNRMIPSSQQLRVQESNKKKKMRLISGKNKSHNPIQSVSPHISPSPRNLSRAGNRKIQVIPSVHSGIIENEINEHQISR